MKFGPLPIRVLTGILFIAHGTTKVVNIPGTRHFFSHALGFPQQIISQDGSYYFIIRSNWRIWRTEKNSDNTFYN